jgi:hypothetical protein
MAGCNFEIFSYGRLIPELMYLFKILKQSISTIVPEVCEALVEGLQEYIKVSMCR